MLTSNKRARPQTIEISEWEAAQLASSNEEEKVAKEDLSVVVNPEEHNTHTSFSEVSLTYSLNIVKKTMSINAVSSSSDYFSSVINFGKVFDRLGAELVIRNTKETLDSIKTAKQFAQVSGATEEKMVENKSGSEIEPAAESSMASNGLKRALMAEFEKFTQYGSCRLIEAKNKDDSTLYRVDFSRQLVSNAYVIKSKIISIESNRATGVISISEDDIFKRILSISKVSADDDDATTVLNAASMACGEACEDTDWAVNVKKRGEKFTINVSAQLPKDEFTEDALVTVELFKLFL
jgi:hypothetical protein